jgi:hypothetical protein
MITWPRSGGVGFTGKSGRRTAEACAASARVRKMQTAACFITTIFIYNNHVIKGKHKIFCLKQMQIYRPSHQPVTKEGVPRFPAAPFGELGDFEVLDFLTADF